MAALLAFSFNAYSDDLQAGLDAHNSGDYSTALKNWLPLAEKGNSVAQYDLGIMYDLGQGVAQDYQQAMHWYRLAAGQGDIASRTTITSLSHPTSSSQHRHRSQPALSSSLAWLRALMKRLSLSPTRFWLP